MHRFFINSSFIGKDYLEFEQKDNHYLRNVLRLKVKDRVNICDEKGNEYRVELVRVKPELIRGRLLDKLARVSESNLKIILGQAIPKGRKLDFIIEKSTELGVREIIPLLTERVMVKLPPVSRKEKKLKNEYKLSRWQRIAREAARQSKRRTIPSVKKILGLEDFCVLYQKEKLKITCFEEETEKHLKDLLKENPPEGKIVLIIGPEGGFSGREIDLMRRYGFTSVKLGPRILRTETVALSVLSIIQFVWGDLS